MTIRPATVHDENNWVREHYRLKAAAKDCNVDSAFKALYERVCYDLDEANGAIGQPGYFHVVMDTDHSFQVRVGPAERDVVRAVFAKRGGDKPYIFGKELIPKDFSGQYDEGREHIGSPVLADPLECVLAVDGRMLYIWQFSQLVLSPVF